MRAGLETPTEGRARDAQVLELLVRRIPVLPFDAPAAQSCGVLRAALRDRRRDVLDRIIAAQAVNAGALLVTTYEAGFADSPGLVVENWQRETAP